MSEPDEEIPEDDQGTALGPDETPDAADPASINRQRRKKAQVGDEIKAFWRGVLGQSVGRQVVWDLIKTSGALESKFGSSPNGSPDERMTYFLNGQQAFGFQIYRTLLLLDREGVAAMHDQCDPDFPKPAKPKMRTANAP